MKRNPRVFLGLLDICGIYYSLESGFRELGVPVYFLDMGDNALAYHKSEYYHPIPEFYRYTHNKCNVRRHHPLRYFWTGLNMTALIIMIIWMILRFDIFIFKSGISLTSSAFDFKLLRLFRKTLVFTYHGSDSRPPYLNAIINIPENELVELTLERKKFIEYKSTFADYIVDSPLSAHFQVRKCCIRQCIFNPVQTVNNMIETNEEKLKDGYITILHAPSLPELKGTDVIRKTINRLKKSGYKIHYREITGVTNETVLREISECDLVVDELYSDTYGAIFALEAAAHGKPAIVCGYAGAELHRFVPRDAVIPTHYCCPEDFESALCKLLDDDAYRSELGRRAKQYASGWASPKSVAGRLMQLASGKAPSHWFFEPHEIRYIYGVGGTREKVRGQIRRLVEYGGEDALFLNDKPELKNAMLVFAQNYDLAASSNQTQKMQMR